jgi:hypothetical protein
VNRGVDVETHVVIERVRSKMPPRTKSRMKERRMDDDWIGGETRGPEISRDVK